MSTAAITNRVSLPAHSHARVYGGITSNPDVPIAGMEQWRRDAVAKVIGLAGLAANWDGHGSNAPSRAARQRALELLFSVPGNVSTTPAIVPVSGGGYHFEWSVGNRELEISIDANSHVETLCVENGMPIDDEAPQDWPALFGWLASQ